MKKLIKITLLNILLLSISCMAEENLAEKEGLCMNSCDNEEIVKVLDNVEARVIEHRVFGFILTTNPEDFDKDSFIASSDFILVPCNWNFSFNHNSIVIISGKKKSCCNLLISPYFRRGGFGCKFEIISIEALTEI
ncbi:hypothetical protein [Litoribacter populi]|uniref:hypothetical protein n=1 Tax=Litoribacter populi TaxID=2598460 RepID=UPI0011815535|nr:hypothetical protein [Litoribacter populi]